jgi:Kdo2-lipid IVA lauroyltransferase/acyltransferase
MLYILRGLIFLLLRLSGYRKKVIQQNIEIIAGFDARIDKERTYLLFQKYFARLFSEIIYSFIVSQKGILKRIRFHNPELVSQIISEKGGAFLLTAHYGNWEMSSLAMPSVFGDKLGAIYLPLSNKRLDSWVKEKRIRFGLHFMSPTEVLQSLRKKQEMKGICFIADQAPANPSTAHWTLFMGRMTSFSPGIERMSKLLKWPVVYGHIQPDGKGNYELFFEKICDDPARMENGEITRKYVAKLQEEILKNPHYWLLSHRRWKHRPEDYPDKIIL